ncbi:hypothetical protein JQC67_08865 [Aurantibacter crassamenti]|uniref:hypothetical protein n=1 Tax=Aurantibacter crassamenti TaxID=1837375 RepID=UPI00193AAD8C|nr:hypothetical protein [Aurantibacter crassamenti]MBM1106245.1 hypothetical protein [Aurantibacter crassamenti]
MVEVFITTISNKRQAKRIINCIKKEFEDLKINFDLDETGLPFPCGHTVLRIEGLQINTSEVIKIVQKEAVMCQIMKDKICV